VDLNEDSMNFEVKEMVTGMYSYVFHRMSLSVYRFVSEERWAKSRGLLIMSSFYLQNVKISVDIEDLLKECAI
jgi:hypothetical protein